MHYPGAENQPPLEGGHHVYPGQPGPMTGPPLAGPPMPGSVQQSSTAPNSAPSTPGSGGEESAPEKNGSN
jgi:hypothetical protein